MTNNEDKILTITARKLQDLELPQQNIVVENLLYEGLVVFAGPPKIGKSWFSLQLGLAISQGEEFLGFKTNRSDVLYMALEDSYRRLQDRLNIMLESENAPERFFICN